MKALEDTLVLAWRNLVHIAREPLQLSDVTPTARMPALLRTIANWNPVSAVTTASRELFSNPNPAAHIHAWPLQHAALASLLWSGAIIAVFAPLATHLYRRRTTD